MSNPELRDLHPDCFRAFAFSATAASTPLAPAGAIRLGGWSILNTDPANPATVELWDGSVTGGGTVALITLANGQADTHILPGKGVRVLASLFLNVIAGSVRGTIYAADPFPE